MGATFLQAENEKNNVVISLVLCVKVKIDRNDVVISLVLKGVDFDKPYKTCVF